LSPTLIFTSQSRDQTLSKVESSCTSFSLINSSLLIIFCLLEFFVKLSQLGIQFSDDLLHFVQFDRSDFQLLFGFFELLSKWSNFLDDVPELYDVDDPRA
jgi:hypothetical protein